MENEKELLINAIIGKGFKSMTEADEFRQRGLATFTGNQWNPDWKWNRTALEGLTEGELRSLYKQT